MKQFLIDNTFDTSVENISGGEKKRLIIAMELTSSVKPNLMCIDEPTSGLDSNAAEVVIVLYFIRFSNNVSHNQVIKCFKFLSKYHNICIITSIHQPNNEILMLFDKLYVLAKGGKTLFTGKPDNLAHFLRICNIACNEDQVPIEVLLKYSCYGFNDENVQKMIEMTQQIEEPLIDSRYTEETVQFLDGIKRKSKRFFVRDLWILMMRSLTHTYRHKWKIISIEFMLYMSVGISLKQVYGTDIGEPTSCINIEDDFNNTCSKTEKKLAEEILVEYNMKYNLYVVVIVLFFSVFVATMTFTAELPIFLNEHRNGQKFSSNLMKFHYYLSLMKGWYSTGVYYWSKSFVELIPLLITILFYSYFVDIYERSMYVLFLTIGALECQSIGHFIGILFSSNQRVAIFTSVAFIIFAFLLSNFFIPIEDMHYSLQILSNLSPDKLVMENILILYYGFDLCSDREFSYVLYFLSIDEKNFYKNTYLSVIQFFIFRTLTLVALLCKVNPLTTSKQQRIEKWEYFQSLSTASESLIAGLTPECDKYSDKTNLNQK